MASHVLLLGLLAISCSLALTSAESPLQDFCVADLKSTGTIILLRTDQSIFKFSFAA